MQPEHWIRQREFHWTQPGKRGEGYILLSGGKPAGSMQAIRTMRESTLGETPFGRWRFERLGFWNPLYHVVEAATGVETARFQRTWMGTGGTLEMAGGARFTWKGRGFLGGDHVLTDEAGRTVLVLSRGLENSSWRDLCREQGRIRRDHAAQDPATLSILLLFAWWMHLVELEETTITTTTVSTFG
jgi:hypothetical protein